MHSTQATAETQPQFGIPPASTMVETRFGVYEFTAANSLYLPQGLLGFSRSKHFGLANLPQPQLATFKLMQSLEDPQLSFIVTPLMEESGLVAQADLDELLVIQGIDSADAAFLLLVTLRQSPSGFDMTVNLRAPVIVDLINRTGRQVVLHNSDYDLRHALPLHDND
jgi:flagellar assembly factor FliW|tara:strand:+ start:14414 stop:14914 length:501 start_codon:yes stop_codon:yes gene_type:complete